jgi:hypothetical protein
MALPGPRLATLTLAAALLAGCGSGTDDAADDPTVAGAADSSGIGASDLDPTAEWLAGEVGRNGFVRGPYLDHGLTLDFATTLEEVGGHDDVVTQILDAMQDPREIEGYLSFYDEKKNGQYAGATAKLVHTVVSADREVADYRDDLLDDLDAMVARSGPEAGRAKDTGGTDYSNAISQAFVVRALAISETEEPLPDAVGFLLQQQCEEGWFRESMSAGKGGEHTCDDGAAADSTPSVDATAHALQALLEVGDRLEGALGEDAAAAVESAAAWLEQAQASDGGHSVSGAADEPGNANSTGLAVEALAAAGRDDAAAEGARWLLDHTIGSSGPLAKDAGAVPFDDQALAKARRNGIKDADRPQWQRSTVEAAGGLHAVAEE